MAERRRLAERQNRPVAAGRLLRGAAPTRLSCRCRRVDGSHAIRRATATASVDQQMLSMPVATRSRLVGGDGSLRPLSGPSPPIIARCLRRPEIAICQPNELGAMLRFRCASGSYSIHSTALFRGTRPVESPLRTSIDIVAAAPLMLEFYERRRCRQSRLSPSLYASRPPLLASASGADRGRRYRAMAIGAAASIRAMAAGSFRRAESSVIGADLGAAGLTLARRRRYAISMAAMLNVRGLFS